MEDSQQKPNDGKLSRWGMVNLAFDMGFVIALPLVGLGLIGKFLDAKFGTEPWLTLIGIVFAIVTTTIWLTRKLKNYLNKQ